MATQPKNTSPEMKGNSKVTKSKSTQNPSNTQSSEDVVELPSLPEPPKTSLSSRILQFIGFAIVILGIYIYKLPPTIDAIGYKLSEPIDAPVLNILDEVDIIFRNRRLMRAPEDITFSSDGNSAYVGTIEGRILRLDLTLPHASLPEAIANVGDPQRALPFPCGEYNTFEICGRVLGITLNPQGHIVFADASKGLVSINQKQRSMKTLATDVIYHPPGKRPKGGRQPREKIKLINSLVIASDGKIYFTLTSRQFGFKDLFLNIFQGKDDGAVAMYDPTTRNASIIAANLYSPNGIVLIENESALLVSETTRARILKIALPVKSNKSDTNEQQKKKEKKKDKKDNDYVVTVWSNRLPTLPDNLSIVGNEVWAAGSTYRQPDTFRWIEKLSQYPALRSVIAKILPVSWYIYFVPSQSAVARMDIETGQVKSVLVANKLKHTEMSYISGAKYHNGYIYFTSYHPSNAHIARLPWDIETQQMIPHVPGTTNKEKRNAIRAKKLQAREEAKKNEQYQREHPDKVQMKSEL